MTDKKAGQSNKSRKQADTEVSLQKELARESAEGADSVGDIGSNRTLTGSSTWETLPGGNKAPAPSKGKAKQSEKGQGSEGAKKKRR
jgi:hypothetical protein